MSMYIFCNIRIQIFLSDFLLSKTPRLSYPITEPPTGGREPRAGSNSIASRSTALVHAATLDGEARIEHDMIEGGRGWLQVARGSLRVNGVALGTGDGVALDGGGTLVLDGADDAEVLLFDAL